MRKLFVLMILISSLFLSSCYTARIMIVNGAKVDKDQPSAKESQSFFVGGIGQTQIINANGACGGRTPAAIDTQLTVIDYLLTALTGSIYSPATYKVYCP